MDKAQLEQTIAGMEVRLMDMAEIRTYARNPRKHSPEQVDELVASMLEFGWTNPCLLAEKQMIAGHGRLMAAEKIGVKRVPYIDLSHLSPAQRRAYVIADNQLPMGAAWDLEILSTEVIDLQAEGFDLELLGFPDDELKDLLAFEPSPSAGNGGAQQPTPEPPSDPVSRIGDVWLLGSHRLICGDATQEETVVRLLAGKKVDVIVTDPPYCSGGFQESDRVAGSVGTDAPHKQIANDRLSSRGYMALLKTAFANLAAPYLYCFTDWRMWVNLFDVAESSGYGVRSMIVWDKSTPGMGRGWRSQHELVMWAAKKTPPYPNTYSGHGNVLAVGRSGNEHHTTEKPVDLIVELLNNTPFAEVIADPFAGSGTTIVAAEACDRVCLASELDPAYVDVCVKRWQNHSELEATLEADGRTFEQVDAERREQKGEPRGKRTAAAAAD